MTHQNHQTNGASLEDCHTNFFALTDLCGIKWRKFVNGERLNASSEPLDDPILRSYSRCMQADILCVWRRVQSTKQENSDPNALPFEISSSKVHPPLSLAAAKELWIFWYGEEPDLSDLVDSELLRVAANQSLWNGTWERGLTYECRSLLFKALHNLMERFVLTKDIVRFGKWFVQPCTSNDRLFGNSSQHLSFSFTFFVHGDTVCASIDLREHPAVRLLTKEHLAEAAAAFATASSNSQSMSQSHEQQQNSPRSPLDSLVGAIGHDRGGGDIRCDNLNFKPRKVILAPFGMAATLTGNSYKASDPITEKILEDWASFFPLCNKENLDVPPVVEVISGGHKMYHPSTYVLVTDLDDIEKMDTVVTSSTEAETLTAASAANDIGVLKPGIDTKSTITATLTNTMTVVEQCFGNHTKYQPFYGSMTSNFTCNTTNTHAPPQAATEMPERAWQNCITNTLHVAYSCATAAPGNSIVANHIGDENSNGNTDSNSYNSNSVAENQQLPQQQLWGFVDPVHKTICSCTKGSITTVTPHGTPHGGASTYSRNSIGDSMAIPSVGSPGTPVPSPHPNSTLSQPTSVPPADQLQNMSPRAPTSVSALPQPSTPVDHLLDKNTPAPTPTDQLDSKSITTSPYVHPAASVEPPLTNEGILGVNFGSSVDLGSG